MLSLPLLVWTHCWCNCWSPTARAYLFYFCCNPQKVLASNKDCCWGQSPLDAPSCCALVDTLSNGRPLHVFILLRWSWRMPVLTSDLKPRAREFSVACRTPTASSWVQCGVPDPNRDPVSSVWRAGPQPRAREFSVACPDLNCDPASSVWRAGPQPRSCEFSVTCRTGKLQGMLFSARKHDCALVWCLGSASGTCERQDGKWLWK